MGTRLRKLVSLAATLGLIGVVPIATSTPTVSAATGDLFISEYIEGGSFNKAIEIYNGTGADVDLAAEEYALELYSNGSQTASQTLALVGTIADGDVYVVANSQAVQAVLEEADTTSGVANFNGDDGVVLRKDGAIVDAFGQNSVDPGSQWPGGGQNDTLRRMESVCAGDTDFSDAFDASIEWDIFAQDTFDGLGTHTADCGASGPTDLLISEYIEGGSFNKAIEIYNGTGADIDLAAGVYTLELYSNGSTTVNTTLSLVGTLADGDVYVVANSQAVQAVLDEADTTSGVANFNGDDSVVLLKDGVIIDAFGQSGVDPGSQWPGGGQNDTLRRMESVCEGDTDWTDPFDASAEWDIFAQDTFDGLGTHTVDCAGDPGGGDPLPEVRFNELHYDNESTDVNEAIEISGPADTVLDGWTVTLYNGSNGEPYGSPIALSGTLTDQGDGRGVTVIDFPSNGIQNGPDTLALSDASGALVEFLSYEGVFAGVGGPADGETSSDIGVAEDGATMADQSLQRDDDGDWDGPLCASFGELNDPFENEFCPVLVKIHEIQGSGDASTIVGQRVIIEGIVVGDQEGPAPALRGFFVQEEDADADADADTSEGIFVFNFDFDEVNVGDLVSVEGTVAEFNGNTQLTDFVDVDILSEGNPLPAATELFPRDPGSDLEAYESMLVEFPQTLVISEYFNYDRFGDVVVALPAPGEDRPYNPTAVFGPDTQEALDRQDLNSRSRITIDDGLTWQNVETPVHPINRQLFSQDNAFRGGDQVSGLSGPLFEGFGGHRILPLAEPGLGFDTYVQTTQPESPDDVGGGLTIATLNALNYFTTIDDGSNNCGPNNGQNCRGADDQFELDRQRIKLLNALEGLDADVIGMVEVENTVGVEPLADLAAGLNDRLGAGTYDYIDSGTDSVAGPDVIKVGILYRPDAVMPIGDAAVLDTDVFLNPNGYLNTDGSQDYKNRAAVASSFVARANGGVFSVVVNHFKSKGSSCAPGDDHPLAGSCNDTRTKAAEELADWLDTSPTGVDDSDWLIVGDLNSYDKEDPISVLTDQGYTDLIAEHVGEFAYSFVFSGEFGYLDYVMSSSSMTDQVTGATEWHINADEPDIFDYDTRFQSDYAIGLFDDTTPFRASDHDAALVGLDLDGPDVSAIIAAAIDEIAELEDAGVLNHGQARSMTRLLELAERQIDDGRIWVAQTLLWVVEWKTDFLEHRGVLTADQADSITDLIDIVQDNI